jgi:threonine/homoserine/homoserine lactone efflux protein
MLKEALLVLSVFFMGFVEAVPIGATQLEIARRSLNGYLSSALMIVVGSVLSDAMYGVIAFWGVAPFLRDNTVLASFWIFGAAASALLGIWAVREGRSHHVATDRSMRLLKKHNLAFLTGFSLAITNPFMIAYWLIGASFLRKAGILQSFQLSDTILLLTAGSLGIASYLVVLAMTVYKVKKFFSDQAIRQITLVFGVVLLILAAYFSFRAATALHAGQGTPEMSGTRAPGRNDYRMGKLVDRAPAAAKFLPTADHWRNGYTSLNRMPGLRSLCLENTA